MKHIKIPAALLIIIFLSSCNIFLGPQAEPGPVEILRSLWNDFNEVHAYIDIRMSRNRVIRGDDRVFNNWEEVYVFYEQYLINEIERGFISVNQTLFNVCGRMLNELDDPHIGLFAPGDIIFPFMEHPDVIRERSWRNIANYLKDGGNFSPDTSRNFYYGVFESEPHIGYIHIASFHGDTSQPGVEDWAKYISEIVQYLAYTDAIVLDLRSEGGRAPNLEYIAAHFASVQENYMMVSTKNGPGRNDFYPPTIHRIKPIDNTYTKYIALLTNKTTVSAAEWFTLALRTQPHVMHMGTATRGAFSGRIPRPMINGWYYTISAQKVTDMNGLTYEGTGISPDPEYILSGDWGEERVLSDYPDRQLNKALEKILERLSQ